MAKKKRKRHRRPIAPPVHSAPETMHAPAGPRPIQQPSTRPEGPEPPAAPTERDAFMPEPIRRREAERRRQRARGRRKQRRGWLIAGLVFAVIVGAIVARQVVNSRSARSFERIAAAAGCGPVRTIGDLSRAHDVSEGARYRTSPPAGGPHDPVSLPAGVYEDPFSTDPDKRPTIYQAVHSLEHGYVIVWQNDLTRSQRATLDRRFRDARKVIVVPYQRLPDGKKMALTAWGRLQYCDKPDPKVVSGFVARYREKTAPERFNA